MTVEERTGKSWDEWFSLLDAWDAASRPHAQIAGWLRTEHGVDGWWAQSVTVTYEQARGLREPGQKRDGLYSTSVSKTIAVSVERLTEAFTSPDLRARWLPAELTARAATKSFRADLPDGTRIAVGFTAKDDTKSVVALAHEKLPDADAVARSKEFWNTHFAALKKLLEG